ncbi:MAG: GAF domain-containing protein [Anaerolineae bacterium]|nr:GAF domain-containing protein [Anaerolineae bacterium]
MTEIQERLAHTDDLAQCQRQLAMLINLDRIRDKTTDAPHKMLDAITHVITTALTADVGLLFLDGDPHPKSVANPGNITSALDAQALAQIAQTAAALNTTSRLDPDRALQAAGIRHILVSPLIVGEQRLGAMLYLSKQRCFDDHDLTLLNVAISQADSAVVQARERQELESRNRQLNAIHRVDRIRDETTDTKLLLIQVAEILADTLEIDLCMIGLKEEGARVTVKAVKDRVNVLAKLVQEEVQTLFDQALNLSGLTPIDAPPSFHANDLDHISVLPLIIDGDCLGVFVLINKTQPLSADQVDLVQAIAGQTDSAIVHLRTFETMQERAKQLEAIYRIDRLRDQTNDVQEILSGISSTITTSLGVDLCLVSLISDETSRSELKTVQDRFHVFGDLDRNALERAIAWASTRKGVERLAQNSPFARWNLNYAMGAPLIVGRALLGSLVLARARQPFCIQEQELLQAIISQSDSAIIQARMARQLEQRNKELETLYRVDKIRDQGSDFGEMLNSVLGELCSAIEAEMGFIMLFDQEGHQLELKASTSDDILATSGHYRLIEQAANHALHNGQLYAADHLDDWLESLMCVPLILRDRVIGVFGAINRLGPSPFTAEDKRLLLAITSQVDTAIFESLERRHLRETFQRYVGPNIVEQMLAMPEKDFLKGDRAKLSMLFSDMRGFTSWSEHLDPGVLVSILNEHLGEMTEIVIANDGTLDKYVGDEVVAIFGAPLPMQEHAFQAIKTALEMQAAQHRLIAKWEKQGYHLPSIGIGINTGEVIVGNIGCEKQMSYTAIGDTVNLASRLCGAAVGGQTLISENTYKIAADRIQADRLPEIRVKGKEQPIQIYQVTGTR